VIGDIFSFCFNELLAAGSRVLVADLAVPTLQYNGFYKSNLIGGNGTPFGVHQACLWLWSFILNLPNLLKRPVAQTEKSHSSRSPLCTTGSVGYRCGIYCSQRRPSDRIRRYEFATSVYVSWNNFSTSLRFVEQFLNKTTHDSLYYE
jgi:hypothetical protein